VFRPLVPPGHQAELVPQLLPGHGQGRGGGGGGMIYIMGLLQCQNFIEKERKSKKKALIEKQCTTARCHGSVDFFKPNL
jgi:hypothetical protein